ncbi:Gfo/Idh/MocA family protein [Corynebacterium pacaense]|uniref:Gfo/Idh/MocA family protein n=1 Tax=Corynebacterium pacaense TaxID=1816684 RepID=UPI0009BA6E67|nr:Gfo/Idh/MocA family oxidoreductase [Corynebacterium pacaense]
MTKLVFGLVGAGRIGKMHLKNVAEIQRIVAPQGIELEVVVADAVPEFAHAAGRELGLRSVDSLEELLGIGLDGLFITTSTSTHPGIIRAGLEAGVPMFCEKPVTGNVPDSIEILRDIEAAGGVVQIGHQRRFDVGYIEAKRRFQSGELGWLHCLKAVSGDPFPPPVSYCATSGGLFRDVSVHDFDIIRWLTGQEIVEVFARGSNKGDPDIGAVGDVDTSLALLTLSDGTLASVAATRYNGAGYDARLDVLGSRDSVVAGLDEHSALTSAEPGVDFPSGTSYPTFAERFFESYKKEWLSFIDLVQGKIDNPCTPFDAVAAALVADAAQLSLATGEAIAVPSLREVLDGSAEPLPVQELVVRV